MAGLCRDNLQNIPVFNDFPDCIEAEDVDTGPVLVSIGGPNCITTKLASATIRLKIAFNPVKKLQSQ
jgi:hypothetical protein